MRMKSVTPQEEGPIDPKRLVRMLNWAVARALKEEDKKQR